MPMFLDQKLSHMLLLLMPMNATRSFDPNLRPMAENLATKNVKTFLMKILEGGKGQWQMKTFLFKYFSSEEIKI